MAKEFGSFIQELKDKIDITDVISKYLPLESKGGKLWARCPFHNEKTASFTVHPEGQFYHCFGCGASGDAIKFVREMESLDFMDAVRLLCEKNSIEMPKSFSHTDSEDTARQKAVKDRLLALTKETAKYYYQSLQNNPRALEYLHGRKIDDKYITVFGLGYAAAGLINHLKQKGFSDDEIALSGVGIKANGRVYDALVSRLIIPIINSMGDVIAFGGRDLEGKSLAKYKNTAETPLFVKSKNIFAVNLLKKNRHKGSVIVVEGYMDVISLTIAGIGGVVASMGTSLTKDQARLIKRFSQDVYICFDGDTAGQVATLRGLDILKEAGLSVKVITMPDELDPDDFVKKYGKQGFERLMQKALPLADFKILTLEKRHNISTADGKRRFASEAIKVIAAEQSKIVREELLKKLSAKTEITYQTLERELENAASPSAGAPAQTVQGEVTAKEIKAARFLLFCALSGVAEGEGAKNLREFASHPAHTALLSYIDECKKQNKVIKLSAALDLCGDEENKKEIISVIESGGDMTGEQIKKAYDDCVKLFAAESYQKKLNALIRRFEGESDGEKRKALLLEIQNFRNQQKKI